uniref:Uncharacterized protein n=1 Tax=Homalodisca liturata TaxID=320908 RepID=A0A1B6ICV3_9HEMI
MKIALVIVLLYVCLAEIFTTSQIQGDGRWNVMMDSAIDNNIVIPIEDDQRSDIYNGDEYSDVFVQSVKKRRRDRRRKTGYKRYGYCLPPMNNYGVRYTGESAVKIILFVLWYLYYSKQTN